MVMFTKDSLRVEKETGMEKCDFLTTTSTRESFKTMKWKDKEHTLGALANLTRDFLNKESTKKEK